MITQHYSFRCDVPGCDSEEMEITTTPMDWERGTGPVNAPPRPELPAGWHRIDEEIVCPKHQVAVDEALVPAVFHPAARGPVRVP